MTKRPKDQSLFSLLLLGVGGVLIATGSESLVAAGIFAMLGALVIWLGARPPPD